MEILKSIEGGTHVHFHICVATNLGRLTHTQDKDKKTAMAAVAAAAEMAAEMANANS